MRRKFIYAMEQNMIAIYMQKIFTKLTLNLCFVKENSN
jgi:hypothetical protein